MRFWAHPGDACIVERLTVADKLFRTREDGWPIDQAFRLGIALAKAITRLFGSMVRRMVALLLPAEVAEARVENKSERRRETERCLRYRQHERQIGVAH